MKCVLFAGIIATILVFGGALNCYHSLKTNKPFNTSDLSIKCSYELDGCAKISSGLANGTSLVFRSCTENSLLFLDDISTFIQNKTLNYLYVDFCDTDNCNNAQSIVAIFSTILTSLFVSIFSSY